MGWRRPSWRSLAAEVEPVAVRQPHVEDDELRRVVARERDAALAGGLPLHLVALGADALDEGLADGGVVFDHEDGLGAVSHGRNRSTGCGRPRRRGGGGRTRPCKGHCVSACGDVDWLGTGACGWA